MKKCIDIMRATAATDDDAPQVTSREHFSADSVVKFDDFYLRAMFISAAACEFDDVLSRRMGIY